MYNINTMCVYCGAYAGDNSAFRQAAENVGTLLAKRNIEIVFGGGLRGLMGITARAAINSGGKVTGIIPEALRPYAEPSCSTLHVAKSMHERKKKMFDLADAFLALPGGLGTVEELTEQLKWIQLGDHSKPVFLLNVANYWTPLVDVFHHMRTAGFLERELDTLFTVCTDTEELELALDTVARHTV
jgi:uncharacterized protein (TIGR00730 family)